MATHAVTSNADPAAVQNLEVREKCLRQLLRDVGVHVVALVVRRLGRIDVETGAAAEIIRIVFALDTKTTCESRKRRLAIARVVRCDNTR